MGISEGSSPEPGIERISMQEIAVSHCIQDGGTFLNVYRGEDGNYRVYRGTKTRHDNITLNDFFELWEAGEISHAVGEAVREFLTKEREMKKKNLSHLQLGFDKQTPGEFIQEGIDEVLDIGIAMLEQRRERLGDRLEERVHFAVKSQSIKPKPAVMDTVESNTESQEDKRKH